MKKIMEIPKYLLSLQAIIIYFIVLTVLIVSSLVLSVTSTVYNANFDTLTTVTKFDDLSVSVKPNAKETPSVYFQNKSDVGFYLSNTDTVDFVTNNEQNIRFGDKQILVDNLDVINGTSTSIQVLGNEKIEIKSSGVTCTGTANIPSGSVTSPGLNVGTVGIYKDSTTFYTTFDNSSSRYEFSNSQIIVPNDPSGIRYAFNASSSIGVSITEVSGIMSLRGSGTRIISLDDRINTPNFIKSEHTGSVASPDIEHSDNGIAFISDDIVFVTGGVDRGRFTASNATLELGVGASGTNEVCFQSNYTDRSLRFKSLTTAQISAISSPVSGMYCYNGTLPSTQFYNGSSFTPNQSNLTLSSTGNVEFTSLTLGSGSAISTFSNTASTVMNLEGALDISMAYRAILINSTVYLSVAGFAGDAAVNTSTLSTVSGDELAAAYRPTETKYFRLLIEDNGVNQLGSMSISSAGVLTIGTGADISDFSIGSMDILSVMVSYSK